MAFPIIINPESTVPLWKQLADALSDAIGNGRLAAGDVLPSTRELARSLGLSRDTVVRSYDELHSLGLIESVGGSSTRVSTAYQGSRSLQESGHETIEATRLPKTQPLSDYARRVNELSLARSTAADFPQLHFGAAPSDLLPSRQWRELVARHCRVDGPGHLYPEVDVFGFLPLREAICSFLRRSKSVRCRAEETVVFSDSQQGLDLIARLLLNTGDMVVVENPGYGGARENFLAHGAIIQAVAIDDHGLLVDEVRRLPAPPKLIYVTPPHHDPTGAVMSLERRQMLLSYARETGAFIVEDAFDSDFTYGSRAMPPLQSLDRAVPVIYMYSFWKSLFPIAHMSCLVLPEQLVDTVKKAKLLVQRNFPAIEHYVLTDLLAEGHLQRHLKRTRAIYERRRQTVLFALSQSFRTSVSYPKESAGLHVLVRFDVPRSDEEIEAAAQKCGLNLVSTRGYYVGQPRSGEFLIPFSSMPESDSAGAIEKFAVSLGIDGHMKR